MWCSSWNEKGYTTVIPTASSSEAGYKINNDYWVSGLSTSDELYFPYTTSIGKCSGDWIASPSAFDGNNLVFISDDGNVSEYGCDDNVSCVRPVVHINSGFTARKDATTGVWNLQ